MKKYILITGVAGFIASKIAEKFKNEKFNVIGIDDLSGGNKKNIPQGIRFIKGDLSHKKTLNSLPKNCYQILHLAGQSSGEVSFDNPISDLKKNTLSTLNLIEYGIASKAKLFLYASSMSVYGKLSKKKASEEDRCNPLSCYGVSKLASEKYLKIFSKKMPFLSLRMFNVYGPGQNMKNLRQGMVSIYLAQAIKNKKIIIKGSLKRVRDFIYIDDVVDAWFKASQLKKNLNQNINIGSGQPVSVKQLVQLIIRKIKKTKFKTTTETKGDQFYVCSNNNLLKTVLNKKQFISLDQGLNKFIKSVKNNI
tara:strand:+ start:1620 stop:2540 length:921 start_codon:yes stop_codon:yes gene_type:complete